MRLLLILALAAGATEATAGAGAPCSPPPRHADSVLAGSIDPIVDAGLAGGFALMRDGDNAILNHYLDRGLILAVVTSKGPAEKTGAAPFRSRISGAIEDALAARDGSPAQP